MKTKIITLAVLVGITTGCASIQETTGMSKTTTGGVVGGVVGCAGGAVLAHMMGGKALVGCAVGAAAGGLIGYQQARAQEIAEAEQLQKEIVAGLNESVQIAPVALNTSAPAKPAPKAVSEVRTKEVVVTDKKTGEKQTVKTLDEISVDIPVSMKGTPEYTAAMDKIRTYATRMADQRGSADILVSMTAQDARVAKVSASTQTAKTDKGNPVKVSRVISNTAPRGMERVVVRPGRAAVTI